MPFRRVLIQYRPQLYKELLISIINDCESVEVINVDPNDFTLGDKWDKIDIQPDVVILSLDDSGKPDDRYLHEAMPMAKIVAFSPSGEFGVRRLPGETVWEEFRPFSINHLLNEVLW